MATRFVFTPYAAEFPSTNFPQLLTVNQRPVLAFDASTAETCYWTGVAPQGITGTLTAAGTLARSIGKTISGALAPAGGLVKSISKSLSGGITPSGAMSSIKAILRSFSGSLTPGGTLTRSIGKTITGALTPAGALVKSISKLLSGLMSPAGSMSSTGGSGAVPVTVTSGRRRRIAFIDAALYDLHNSGDGVIRLYNQLRKRRKTK